jgi:hypothetical protein
VDLLGDSVLRELTVLLDKNIKPFAAMVRHKAIEYADHFLEFLKIDIEESKYVLDIIPECEFGEGGKTAFAVVRHGDYLEVVLDIDKKVAVSISRERDSDLRALYPNIR